MACPLIYLYTFQDPHNELTGQNVLIVKGSLEKTAEHFKMEERKVAELLGEGRKLLFKERQARPKPHRDDKILTSWNGNLSSVPPHPNIQPRALHTFCACNYSSLIHSCC